MAQPNFEILAEKRKKIRGRSPLQDEPEEPDDYIDEEMRKTDEGALERIRIIVEDYAQDMKNYSGQSTTSLSKQLVLNMIFRHNNNVTLII